MGNLLASFQALFWKQEMELTLVGLQKAGKSTLVNVLTSGSANEETLPTVGFQMRRIKKNNVTMKVWDIGGQARFRAMWDRYCRGVNCIVYVVDAADAPKIELSKSELHSLMAKESLNNIPLLVLGNKNDLPGHKSAEELSVALDLASIQNREVACYSISAKNVVNIDITLDWLTRHANRGA